jgi:MFS family permease
MSDVTGSRALGNRPTGRLAAWGGLDRRVWIMAMARAVNTAGMSLVMSFLAVHLVTERGSSGLLYGFIGVVANVGQSLSNAWAGNLSDRIGRRPLITGSLVLRAAVMAVLGVQILLEAPLWTIAVNIAASSALRGCFEPVAYALVSDVVTPDQRIAALGLQRMGTNLGWAIGPAVGGALTLIMPYGAIFFLAAAGCLLAAITTTRVADPRPRGRAVTETPHLPLTAALADASRQPVMVALLAGTFLAAVVHTQIFSTLAVYATSQRGLDLSEGALGLVYTVYGLAVLVLQLPAVGFIRRLGLDAALVASSFIYVVGFALIGQAETASGLMVAIAVVTAAEVVFAPAHQAAIAETGDSRRLGRAYGVAGFTQMLGVACAPLLGLGLFDVIGHRHLVLWGTLAAVAVAMATSFLAFARLRSGRR